MQLFPTVANRQSQLMPSAESYHERIVVTESLSYIYELPTGRGSPARRYRLVANNTVSSRIEFFATPTFKKL